MRTMISKMPIHFTGPIRSPKIRSLLEMDMAGLPVITTFQMDSQGWTSQLLNMAPSWVTSGPLYVRICFDTIEYPHSFYKICRWEQLPEVIPALIAQTRKLTDCPCDITIQPHLHERLGGAVAMIENVLIIECVDGNARALLREGHFNYRRIIHLTGEPPEEVRGQQTQSLVWQGDCYRHLRATPIAWDTISIIGNFYYEPFCLYEWCILKNGEPLFLEKKPLSRGSFSFQNMYSGQVFLVSGPPMEQTKAVYHKIPSLELIAQLDKSRLHIFTGGGYLSHLSYYAAEKKIPMMFA